MSSKERQRNIASKKQKSQKPNTKNSARDTEKQMLPGLTVQRARLAPNSLTSSEVLQLQRTLGNRAVGRLLPGSSSVPVIQARPTVGLTDDANEQEGPPDLEESVALMKEILNVFSGEMSRTRLPSPAVFEKGTEKAGFFNMRGSTLLRIDKALARYHRENNHLQSDSVETLKHGVRAWTLGQIAEFLQAKNEVRKTINEVFVWLHALDAHCYDYLSKHKNDGTRFQRFMAVSELKEQAADRGSELNDLVKKLTALQFKIYSQDEFRTFEKTGDVEYEGGPKPTHEELNPWYREAARHTVGTAMLGAATAGIAIYEGVSKATKG